MDRLLDLRDPDRPVDISLGATPNVVTLRKICEQTRAGRGTTVVLVSHDLDAIRDACTRCLWLDRGRVVADGAPAEVMASSIVQEAYLGTGGGSHD